MYTVADIMTTDLYTLSPAHTLADARHIMAENNIRHIPVLDEDGQLKGVVSQRDVLSASGSSVSSAGSDGSDIPLAAFMTTKVTTVDDKADLRGAALFLQKQRFGCLPVVEQGRLVGIVTDSDYVGVAINLLEQLEEVEPLEEFQEDL